MSTLEVTKDLRVMFFWGLPFILGEIWTDILIDMYLGAGDIHNFGWWLDKNTTDEEFVLLVIVCAPST